MLRLAPFAATRGNAPMQRLTAIAPTTHRIRVTCCEVAAFALACAKQGRCRRKAVLFGHSRA